MWELAAHCSKASAREARLVGRKVCFTLEACSWREGGLLLKGQLPTDGGRALKGDFRGAQAKGGATRRAAHSALTVVSRLVISGLISVVLVVLRTVSLRFQVHLCFISLNPVLGLWQPMSWLRSGLHTVSFFHLSGFSVYTQLAGHGSEYCHSPWGGKKGPWLCSSDSTVWSRFTPPFASACHHSSV